MKHNKILLICVVLAFLISSCAKIQQIGKQEFAQSNWDFEHRIVEFTADISATELPYRFTLKCEVNPQSLPESNNVLIIMTIISPDGAETSRKTNLLLQPVIENKGKYYLQAEVYPHKYFTMKGLHTFRIVRIYEKYDLFGFKNISLNMQKLKEKN